MSDFLGDPIVIADIYRSKAGKLPGEYEHDELYFHSSTETIIPASQTEAFIPDNWMGYWDGTGLEAEKLGADQLITTGLENLHILPYPDLLRPVSDYSFLKDKRHVIIVGIEFRAFDLKATGGSGQTAAVTTELLTSISSQNEIHPQTVMRFTSPPDWDFNFFNPKFMVGNTDVLNSNQTHKFNDTDGQGNRGDLSVGKFLPYRRLLYKYFPSAPRSLNIFAFCGNRIVDSANPTNIYVRRFPLKARVIVTYV